MITDDLSYLFEINIEDKENIDLFNATDVLFDRDALIDDFIYVTGKDGSREACIYENQKLTRSDLSEKVSQYACTLQSKGVVRHTIVAIALPPSPQRLIAVLAVLRCGGVFLPLDIDQPLERLLFQIADSKTKMLLLENEFSPLKVAGVASLTLSTLEQGKVSYFWDDPSRKPSDWAYIIYTSGSTGKPKATINTHRALVNRLQWMANYLAVKETDRICHKTAFCFDVSVWEQLLPCFTGACIVIAPDQTRGNHEALVRLINEKQISIIHFVPVMLSAFIEYGEVSACISLRAIISSGEALPKAVAAACTKILTATLYNLYGPSETAIDVTAWEFDARDDRSFVPIGKPIQNTQIRILDSKLNPAQIGVAGDLYIGGEAVGDGYLHRPALTADRFLPDAYSKVPGSRLYKTGDRARWHEDGVIEFIGRSDFQVKIRGFRIEPGEIECALLTFPSIARAAVIVHMTAMGTQQLIAYVICKKSAVLDHEQLNAYLLKNLPSYMQPSAIMEIDSFPVTRNGKLDREALPKPFSRNGLNQHDAAPRTEAEVILCDIWSSLLKCEVKNIGANFFAQGGDSISAIRVVIAAGKRGLELQVKDIFDYPVLQALAKVAKKTKQEIHQDKSPVITAWEKANEETRANAAPVAIYEIDNTAKHFLLSELARFAKLFTGDTTQPGLYMANDTGYPDPFLAAKDLSAKVAGKHNMIFAAATAIKNRDKSFLIIVFDPARADYASLAYLSNLIEGDMRKPWFMHYNDLPDADSSMQQYKAPPILKITAGHERGATMLFENFCRINNDNHISRERQCEALIVRTIRHIFRIVPMTHLHLVLPESRSFVKNDGFSSRELFGRIATPFETDIYIQDLQDERHALQFIANARAGNARQEIIKTGFRFRIVIMAHVADTGYLKAAPGINTSVTASAGIGRDELLLVIGTDRLEWRWDVQAGDWPMTLIDDLRKDHSIPDFLEAAAQVRIASDFQLSGLDNAQLNSIAAHLKTSEDVYPLSPLQEGLLLRTIYWPESDAYLNQNVIELIGDLDVAALEKAWDLTVARYNVLRTGYLWEDLSEPLQFVADHPTNKPEIQNWIDATDVRGVDERLAAYLKTDREQLFDMKQAGLFRLTLARTGINSHLLIWSHHHILLDGWCLALIWGDVFKFYADSVKKLPVNYPIQRSYRDYIAWYKKFPPGQKDKDFWRNYLANFNQPTFFSHQKVEIEGRFETKRLLYEDKRYKQLKETAALTGVTVNAIVQTAWALLLGLKTGSNDVIFGVSVSGRPTTLAESEHMVGLFINTIPVRLMLHPWLTLEQLLRNTQDKFSSANNHSNLPLAAILAEWSGRTSPDERLFDNLIAFENYPDEHLPATNVAGIEVRDRFCNEKTEYPIGLIVLPNPSLEFHFNYDCSHFELAEIDHLIQDFLYLIDSIVDTPGKQITGLTLPSAKADNLMSHGAYSDRSFDHVTDTIFGIANIIPNDIAVISNNQTLSYQQLRNVILYTAQEMRARVSGDLIVILAERSVSFIVATLAAWHCGLVPLIINPALPDEMIKTVIDEHNNPLIAVSPIQRSRIGEWRSESLLIDTEPKPDVDKPAPSVGHRLAAILLTSGSTGTPKQVAITWLGLANRLYETIKLYDTGRPALLANAAPGFDIGLWELLFPLLAKGKLILAYDDDITDPDRICDLVGTHDVNILHTIPSYGERLLACQKSTELSRLKILVTGGEIVRPAYLSRLRDKLPATLIWQGYGPTEGSVSVLDHLCSDENVKGARIPLGKPTDGCTVYLLDEAYRCCQPGVAGMIYIGGMAVARGYIKDPRKTANSFIPDPFGRPGSRLYCTGDFGVLRKDGTIEFLYRKDRQVKIRGYRVEPGAIEQKLATHPLIMETVVMVSQPSADDAKLIAFATLSKTYTDMAGNIESVLHDWLAERLPIWSCPSRIYIVENFALNANGKIDTDALLVKIQELKKQAALPEAALSGREKIIFEVWADILGTPPESRHTNFFSAGGHSLSAMRFILALQKKLGAETKVPVSLLFKYPTPAKLSEVILSPAERSGDRSIYTISEGKRPALVMVHPVEGTSMAYATLPDLLPGHKIMVIDNPRFDHPKGFSSLTEMAALYAEWVRLLTDDGPVVLGGWSLGGAVALEMARIMSRHRTEPIGLVMIDSYNLAGRLSMLNTENSIISNVRTHARDLDDQTITAIAREIQRNQLLALSHRPEQYNGNVLLLKAANREIDLDRDLGSNNGWSSETVPNLEVKDLPCSHHDIFSQNNAPFLAKELYSFIQEFENVSNHKN